MTITSDPWATTPAAPEPTPEPAPVAAAAPAAATTVTNMAPAVQQSGGDEITLTFKEHGGFDASWIVIRAASVAAANAILDAHEGLQALMAKTKAVAGFYRQGSESSSGGSSNGGGGGSTQNRNAAPQGAKQAPDWAPPKPHDDFVYKTGISKKTGNTWHAWMPPTKEDSRDAEFFYPPR